MNAVIYARYSSDNQREESIEGQLRECREYAERNGMTVVGTYIDRALSAKTADRPEFQHMIKDSAKELFEVVLVWKLDRFSRDRYDSAHYKHILKKNGVKVVSAKEHISEGPEGIILEAMLEGYAEFYSAELSEKIHRGQKENALKGKNNGGGIPLGYLLDKKEQKLVVDPVTAPLVIEVFERYASGETVRSIVEDFNVRGLRTRKGRAFNMNSFGSLLKNRKYIGEYRYQDVVIAGGVPAIVPEDLFYRVQERMEKNRHAPAMSKAKEDYLLTTKLFCGKCERMMVGESGKSHTGVMHYYYKCGGAKRRQGCDKKAVRKDWIERVVVRLTMQRVMDEGKINRLIDAILVMQEREDTTTPALRSQLAETESAISNLLKAIEQGIFTPSTKQRLEELEAQKEEILVNIQTAELQKPKLTREQMTAWFEQFRHGDPENRDFQKRLIDTFVNSVYVFDDKLVLTYNYQHGTQTISLEEIESALGSDLRRGSPPSLKADAFRLFLCAAWKQGPGSKGAVTVISGRKGTCFMPEHTRSAVIRSTILLFNQYGPMVPMSKISEHAGVAAGTPFRYFSTKEELLAAAYREAHENTLRCVPQEPIEGMDAERAVKSIVHTIMKWSVICPQDLEYMRKYEDMVCYDCFSERFSETLYVGVIREMNLWPLLEGAVRPDLPEPLLNRLISINCSIYSRYIIHLGLLPEDPAFSRLADATADSIWNSIRAQ